MAGLEAHYSHYSARDIEARILAALQVHKGSALDMPFPDDSFDAAWMQNVGMNIADNFLVSADEMRSVLGESGYIAELLEDTSDVHLSKTGL
jgi:ubiquinone/menaquinone biosynthesis C-methylase UbiE